MIISFLDSETELIFNECFSRKLPIDIQRRCLIKLMALNAAANIGDMTLPKSNKLEKLFSGKYNGYYSIRINDQWRIIFKTNDNGKNYYDVSIVDYH